MPRSSNRWAPDILVNNAAVTFLRPLDGFPEKRARLMVEMHMLAPLHLTQLAIPAMRERGRGWVLNLTSVGGDLPEGPPFAEFDRDGRLRDVRHREGGAEPADQKPCRRAVRDGIAVNAAAPSNPVATPGAGTLDLAKTDTEDIELITETAFRLCTGDPKTMTGRIAHTQDVPARGGMADLTSRHVRRRRREYLVADGAGCACGLVQRGGDAVSPKQGGPHRPRDAAMASACAASIAP